MKHRVFIAIDLPPELKTKVGEVIKQWRWLPIRWLAPESWHITVVPPVYLDDREAGLLSALVGRSRFGKPFPVRFSRVVLAPPGMPARMIWLEGDTSEALIQLKRKLGKAWASVAALPPLEPESRAPHLHVTLARFGPGELAELETKTRVLDEVDFRFEASEVAVMESHLKPSGAEYEQLATARL